MEYALEGSVSTPFGIKWLRDELKLSGRPTKRSLAESVKSTTGEYTLCGL